MGVIVGSWEGVEEVAKVREYCEEDWLYIRIHPHGYLWVSEADELVTRFIDRTAS